MNAFPQWYPCFWARKRSGSMFIGVDRCANTRRCTLAPAVGSFGGSCCMKGDQLGPLSCFWCWGDAHWLNCESTTRSKTADFNQTSQTSVGAARCSSCQVSGNLPTTRKRFRANSTNRGSNIFLKSLAVHRCASKHLYLLFTFPTIAVSSTVSGLWCRC